MSTKLPPLSARVTALERSQIMLNARIEEIAEDVADSFAAQAPYQTRIEEKIDALSEKVDKIEVKVDKIEVELGTVKAEIGTVKTEMVAMENRIQGNMNALEKRVLDAFQQLVIIIDTRLPPLEK